MDRYEKIDRVENGLPSVRRMTPAAGGHDAGRHGEAAPVVALVTNIPTPYRLPICRLLGGDSRIRIRVVFCSGREPDREWDLAEFDFPHEFLQERFYVRDGKFVHNNPDVISALRRIRPDVVITTGFNPTCLYAFVYAIATGAKHVPMTDGTEVSERSLSMFHRAVRRIVFGFSTAYIGASDGSLRLYRTYGLPENDLFKSHLCVDNDAIARSAGVTKKFDFVFCGRLVAPKNPFFAVDVCGEVATRLGRQTSLLVVGSGALMEQMREYVKRFSESIRVEFAGFAKQAQLPGLYGTSRIFLFPTSGDTWGIVVNEACAAGLPVIASPAAGVSGEIVRNGQNGYVLNLDASVWAERAVRLLTDDGLYRRFSDSSRSVVKPYNFQAAAGGIVAASLQAVRRPGGNAFGDAAGDERPRRRVVIVQRRMTHYRAPLFERLRDELQARGIVLHLLIGVGTRKEEQKHDGAVLPWAISVPTHYIGTEMLCWQPLHRYLGHADLIVVAQENKLLYNPLLMLSPRRRVVLWGHGANLQTDNRNGLRERFKRWLSRKADWWFAYTELSARLMRDAGIPPERLTVLDNAIDVGELVAERKRLSRDEIATVANELNLSGKPVGVFLGSLYPGKRLDFLIASCLRVRREIPTFHLLVIGDGPAAPYIRQAIRDYDWVKWVGARHGREKVAYCAAAQVLLNPGVVGVNILDSFALGVPMIATDRRDHGPEIAYLEHDVNGFMTCDNIEDFSGAVVRLLQQPEERDRLVRGCLKAAAKYTIQNMASRFVAGIEAALQAVGS